jgi:ubiquinone/menaquinone biosynthesis C-methylase UbiE
MALNRVLDRLADGLFALRRWLLDQPLFTSTILPAIPRPLRWAMRRAYLAPADVIDRVAGRRTDMVPPRSKMFVGSVEDFERSGDLLVERLVELGGLTPASSVLDLGSGIGRLAVALTRRLGPSGRYEGLDVVPTGIEWCAEHITPRHPNFRFTLADVYNGEYNPGGTVQPSEYRLPYPDESFDLVVLTSVFTHMLPEDMDHYVDEIARVLKPGGRCFATYSLLNGESRRLMEEGRSDTRFKHAMGPCAVVDEKVPELAVAYEEEYVGEVFRRRGLLTEGGVHYGSWSGRDPEAATTGLSQDVVLATKSPA